MDLKEARGIAAACWTDSSNDSKEMDSDLAESFARRLMMIHSSSRVQLALDAMRVAFHDDKDFFDTYVANVAMLLSDRFGVTDYEARNKMARAVLMLVFFNSR